MGEWKTYYRVAHRSHELRAKVASGGEPFGDPEMGKKAVAGQWLCESIQNGYRWVCSEMEFAELYCEVGKHPPRKKKKQEDGYRKGKSRKRSASHEEDRADFEVGLFMSEEDEVKL
jgi:hypothetical protein